VVRTMRVGVVIAAAGKGERMGQPVPKQFLPLGGMPILLHTIRAFEHMSALVSLLVAVHPRYLQDTERWCRALRIHHLTALVPGGSTRQASVWNALQHPSIAHVDVVLVHDAVRPFVSQSLLNRLLAAVQHAPAVVPALPLKDTIKQVESQQVRCTLNRSELVAVQTPQAFHRAVLVDAHRAAQQQGWIGTDDAALVEQIGVPVAVVPGEEHNLKITTPFDLHIAQLLLDHRQSLF